VVPALRWPLAMVHVLLWAPNLIGYARLALLLAAFSSYADRIEIFAALLAATAALDAVDGAAARKLDLCSAFGAFFDVAIDNLHRTLLWALLFPRGGAAMGCFEWLTFACTHCQGETWKADVAQAPALVRGVMADGFKRPLGVLAMAGVWGLPHALLAQRHLPDHRELTSALVAVCAVGRLLAFTVECWFVQQRVRHLCDQDGKRM